MGPCVGMSMGVRQQTYTSTELGASAAPICRVQLNPWLALLECQHSRRLHLWVRAVVVWGAVRGADGCGRKPACPHTHMNSKPWQCALGALITRTQGCVTVGRKTKGFLRSATALQTVGDNYQTALRNQNQDFQETYQPKSVCLWLPTEAGFA